VLRVLGEPFLSRPGRVVQDALPMGVRPARTTHVSHRAPPAGSAHGVARHGRPVPQARRIGGPVLSERGRTPAPQQECKTGPRLPDLCGMGPTNAGLRRELPTRRPFPVTATFLAGANLCPFIIYRLRYGPETSSYPPAPSPPRTGCPGWPVGRGAPWLFTRAPVQIGRQVAIAQGRK
jgi:hypothetical protein